MKILIVSPFENTATGRGDRNLRLEKELRCRGHDVTLLTGNFDHGKKSHIDAEKLPERDGLKVISMLGYRENVGAARIISHIVFSVRLWFYAIRTRWDVIVISSIPPEALLAARFLRRRSLVLDVRDIWPDALAAYGRPSLAARIFSAYCDVLFRVSIKHVDKVMIVAPGYRQWLRRYIAFKHGQVKFVPLGFRREDFQPLSEGGSTYAFCYAGGVTPQFDIREFSKEFGDKKGIVLGSGPLIDAWQKAFPFAEFRGAVPRADAMKAMCQSHKLLFPSNPYAQLPNKAFDYFAMGHRVALGRNVTRATRYLLFLRRRRALGSPDCWEHFRAIEKESLVKRAAGIIEKALA